MKLANDIRNFLQGNWNFFNREHNAKHINEQAEWRAFLCQDCLKAGKCRICHCQTPNMFYSPNKIDSAKKWGKMLNEQEWKTFKVSSKEYQLFLAYKKQKQIEDNVGNTLYRDEQRLLGYTPPVTNPVPKRNQEVREEEIFGSTVGDSPDSSLTLTILQSPSGGEDETSGSGLLRGNEGTGEQPEHSPSVHGSNNVTGTEASNKLEEEDRREEQTN